MGSYCTALHTVSTTVVFRAAVAKCLNVQEEGGEEKNESPHIVLTVNYSTVINHQLVNGCLPVGMPWLTSLGLAFK